MSGYETVYKAAPTKASSKCPPPRCVEPEAQYVQDASLRVFERNLQKQIDKLHLMVDSLRDQHEVACTIKTYLRALGEELKTAWSSNDKEAMLHYLGVCSQKLHSIEFRQCQESKEFAAAVRMIDQFCEASARGTISKSQVQVFCEFCRNPRNEPRDFSYGWINTCKDVNRPIQRWLKVFHKYTEVASLAWPDIQMEPEGDQTGILACFHPEFRALVLQEDPEAYHRLPDLNEECYKGMMAGIELLEDIDHKDNVIPHCKNLKTFLSPQRYDKELHKMLGDQEIKDHLNLLPRKVLEVFEAFPSELDESATVKFTKVVNHLYYLGLASQNAKAAIQEANYIEEKAAEKTQTHEEYWAVQRVMMAKMRSILPEDDLWLHKIAAETREKAKKRFQTFLHESGGFEVPVIGTLIDTPSTRASSGASRASAFGTMS